MTDKLSKASSTRARNAKRKIPKAHAIRTEQWPVRLGWSGTPFLMDTEELCESLQCDPRTIVNYVKRGMPRAQARPRPLYPSGDCIAWAIYFEHLKRVFQETRKTPPWHISIDDAVAWVIRREYEMHPVPCNAYVMVPLDARSPRRAELLRKACEGIDLGYVDDDDIDHPPEDAA